MVVIKISLFHDVLVWGTDDDDNDGDNNNKKQLPFTEFMKCQALC